MDEGGQPEGPTSSANTSRRTRVLMSLVVAFGVAAGQLSTGWPANVGGWLLLITGSAVAGIAATPVPGELFPPARRAVGRYIRQRPSRRIMLLCLSAILALGLGRLIVVTAPPAAAAAQVWWRGCPPATAVQLLTSPDQLEASWELAEAFEADTAERHWGCPTADLYVYAAPPAKGRDAVAAGWSAEQMRLIGPRPDVWLPGGPVDEITDPADASNGQLLRTESIPIASSPVVLAATPELMPASTTADRNSMTWEEVLTDAADLGWTVTRPDPTLSTAGRLATVAVYASASDRPGTLVDSPGARSIERRLGQGLDRTAYPLGSDIDLLCRHRQLRSSATVIVSEQAMLRANAGAALGGRCGSPTVPLPPTQSMLALYPPDTRTVEHSLIRLDWVDTTAAVRAATDELRTWLTGSGRRALGEVGLRPRGFPATGLVSERYGALPGASYRHDPPTAEVLALADDRYAAAQRPGRVLLAIDGSGSMRQAAGGGRTRFDLAAQAVRRSLGLLGGPDEFGLWSFPDRQGPVRRLAPIGPLRSGSTDRRAAAIAALQRVRPGGDTPLYRTIVDGVAAVGHDEDKINAVVAITDGEDFGSGLGPGALQRAVEGRGVRVFVIAVGDASCGGEVLASVTASTGGGCFDTTLDHLDTQLSELFAVLWGGGA